MGDQQPSTTPPVGEPTAPIAGTAPNQVVAAPVEPTGGHRRRRWWILVVLGIVVVVVLLAIARNRNEESAQRHADETATSVPATVAPGGAAPGEVPGGGGSGDASPDQDGSGGESPADVTALAAPTLIRIPDECQEIAPVNVAPCTVTVYWVDRATDETAYRVVVETQKGGARIAQLASNSTSYGTGAGVGDTVCFEVVVVRGDETASSGQQCTTTDLDQ
jgi:hypothetical protein